MKLNLKPTTLKIILTLIIFLIFLYNYQDSLVVCSIFCFGDNCPPCVYPNYFSIQLLLLIVIPVLFYLIYSIIENK